MPAIQRGYVEEDWDYPDADLPAIRPNTYRDDRGYDDDRSRIDRQHPNTAREYERSPPIRHVTAPRGPPPGLRKINYQSEDDDDAMQSPGKAGNRMARGPGHIGKGPHRRTSREERDETAWSDLSTATTNPQWPTKGQQQSRPVQHRNLDLMPEDEEASHQQKGGKPIDHKEYKDDSAQENWGHPSNRRYGSDQGSVDERYGSDQDHSEYSEPYYGKDLGGKGARPRDDTGDAGKKGGKETRNYDSLHGRLNDLERQLNHVTHGPGPWDHYYEQARSRKGGDWARSQDYYQPQEFDPYDNPDSPSVRRPPQSLPAPANFRRACYDVDSAGGSMGGVPRGRGETFDNTYDAPDLAEFNSMLAGTGVEFSQGRKGKESGKGGARGRGRPVEAKGARRELEDEESLSARHYAFYGFAGVDTGSPGRDEAKGKGFRPLPDVETSWQEDASRARHPGGAIWKDTQDARGPGLYCPLPFEGKGERGYNPFLEQEDGRVDVMKGGNIWSNQNPEYQERYGRGNPAREGAWPSLLEDKTRIPQAAAIGGVTPRADKYHTPRSDGLIKSSPFSNHPARDAMTDHHSVPALPAPVKQRRNKRERQDRQEGKSEPRVTEWPASVASASWSRGQPRDMLAEPERQGKKMQRWVDSGENRRPDLLEPIEPNRPEGRQDVEDEGNLHGSVQGSERHNQYGSRASSDRSSEVGRSDRSQRSRTVVEYPALILRGVRILGANGLVGATSLQPGDELASGALYPVGVQSVHKFDDQPVNSITIKFESINGSPRSTRRQMRVSDSQVFMAKSATSFTHAPMTASDLRSGYTLRASPHDLTIASVVSETVYASGVHLQIDDVKSSIYMSIGDNIFIEAYGNAEPKDMENQVKLLSFMRSDRFADLFFKGDALREVREDLEAKGFSIDLGIYQLGPGKLIADPKDAPRIIEVLRERKAETGKYLKSNQVLVTKNFEQLIRQIVKHAAPRSNPVKTEEMISLPLLEDEDDDFASARRE